MNNQYRRQDIDLYEHRETLATSIATLAMTGFLWINILYGLAPKAV